jgi:hypothetical protein
MKEVEIAITEEIITANKETQGTSRLTSLVVRLNNIK